MTATAQVLRQQASNARQEAADSFDRCDTDGFMSQWASGLTAQKLDLQAELVESDGKIEISALFTRDGKIASAHQGNGQYGSYWVLNDEAAALLGRRFVSESSASKGERRYNANKKKGFTVGTIRVAGYVDTVGTIAVNVRYVCKPVVADLVSGDFEIITTDRGVGADW